MVLEIYESYEPSVYKSSFKLELQLYIKQVISDYLQAMSFPVVVPFIFEIIFLSI